MLLDLHQLIYGGEVVVAPAPTPTEFTYAAVVDARLYSRVAVLDAGRSAYCVILDPNETDN